MLVHYKYNNIYTKKDIGFLYPIKFHRYTFMGSPFYISYLQRNYLMYIFHVYLTGLALPFDQFSELKGKRLIAM